MNSASWTVTPRVVAALVRGAGGMPAPDGDDFDPRGPIGPIAYELYRHLSQRHVAVALNPQPIPPVDEMARLVAQGFVSHLIVQNAAAAGTTKADKGGERLQMQISEFEDRCGTGRTEQWLAELFRKLGPPKGGGEPAPRPNEIDHARALVVIGAELHAARGLVPELAAAGERLMAQGLKQFG